MKLILLNAINFKNQKCIQWWGEMPPAQPELKMSFFRGWTNHAVKIISRNRCEKVLILMGIMMKKKKTKKVVFPYQTGKTSRHPPVVSTGILIM